MPNPLKQLIQNYMVGQMAKKYSRKLKEKQDAYDAYVKKQEDKLRREYGERKCELSGRVVLKEDLPGIQETFSKEREAAAGDYAVTEDVLIVISGQGILNPLALPVILSYFEEHEECMLLYADEDMCRGSASELEQFQKSGSVKVSARCKPLLKPIPAPETFLSYQYFGNIWAVRTEFARQIADPSVLDGQTVNGQTVNEQTAQGQSPDRRDNDLQVFEYDLLLRMWEKAGMGAIAHLPEILFHRFEEEAFWGFEERFAKVKEAYCGRQGISMKMVKVTAMEEPYCYPVYEILEDAPKVSILIPSKDNPEILRQCLSSIYEKSTYTNFEIVVVDNGSCAKNQEIIENMRGQYPFVYLYHPMEFNYSAMNNMAARVAAGELLLLLNDDMEVVSEDWLERMVGQLMQEGIGAVGAKLLYPNTTLIQHVGITNAVDGPVHKLLKKNDTPAYHQGRNKLVYNVVGVTGACLMIKKDEFLALGGLKEDLRVAYNDVDLCFSLYEKGLRNVVRNDVILYHHESLSRGVDAMSDEKMKRLKWERDYLYTCHPGLCGKDPYEGANNRGGAEFGVLLEVDYDAPKEEKDRLRITNTDYTRYPAGICVWFDRVETEHPARTGNKEIYVLEGYAILPESDNCRYDFELVLMGEGATYSVPLQKQIRPNLEAGYPNASNIELSGFYYWIAPGEIPQGQYTIGIYAWDHCSRQKLFQNTERIVNIIFK